MTNNLFFNLNQEIKLFFPKEVQMEFRVLPNFNSEIVKVLIMSEYKQIEFMKMSPLIMNSLEWILQQNFNDKSIELLMESF